MIIPDDVKQQSLAALETAHQAKSTRLIERLRICNGSLKEWEERWRRLRQAPFISFADAEKFDADAAWLFLEDAHAKVAATLGLQPEDFLILKFDARMSTGFVVISAEIGQGADAVPFIAWINAAGKIRVVPFWEQAWEKSADGKLISPFPQPRSIVAETPCDGTARIGGAKRL